MLSIVYNGVDITHTVNGTLADWTSTKRLSFRKAAANGSGISTGKPPRSSLRESELCALCERKRCMPRSASLRFAHRSLEVPGAYLVIAGSSVIDSSLTLSFLC